MNQDGGGSEREGPGDAASDDGTDFPAVEGLAVDEAVERVVEADEAHDPPTVKQALSHVADDGVVAESAVQDALGHLSKVVSTPETRVELAAIALDDAREAADPVADLATVRSRLDAYAATLADLEDRLDDLRDSLQAVVERGSDPDSLYAVGRDVQRVTEEANAVQQRADELQLDLEEFESWLDDPDARTAQLDQDADSVETTVEDLHDVAEALELRASDEEPPGEGPTESDEGPTDSDEGSTGGGEGSAGGDQNPSTVSVPGPVEVTDPAVAWVDATFRQRVVELLLADLRAELADLREWNDREDVSSSGLDDVADRLDALDDRATDLATRLDELARPAWTDRYGDRLTAFDDQLADAAAPIDWASVEATLAEHRSSVLGTA